MHTRGMTSEVSTSLTVRWAANFDGTAHFSGGNNPGPETLQILDSIDFARNITAMREGKPNHASQTEKMNGLD